MLALPSSRWYPNQPCLFSAVFCSKETRTKSRWNLIFGWCSLRVILLLSNLMNLGRSLHCPFVSIIWASLHVVFAFFYCTPDHIHYGRFLASFWKLSFGSIRNSDTSWHGWLLCDFLFFEKVEGLFEFKKREGCSPEWNKTRPDDDSDLFRWRLYNLFVEGIF